MKRKQPICEHCWEYKTCVCRWETCSICWVTYSNYDINEKHQIFEYRWALACWECFDKLQEKRDFERQEIIEEENHKTEVFKWLDMWDSIIGKANRKILKRNIEIASKESLRIKSYENN